MVANKKKTIRFEQYLFMPKSVYYAILIFSANNHTLSIETGHGINTVRNNLLLGMSYTIYFDVDLLTNSEYCIFENVCLIGLIWIN